MSLLAESSPPPQTRGKQLSKNVGLNSNSFPSNFKHPKSSNVKESVTSHCKDDDHVGQRSAYNIENTVGHQEDSWERDLEELAAIIAEAEEFINLFEVKYSASKELHATEDTVLLHKLDECPSRKRMKVEYRIQEEKSFGMGTKSDDNDEEQVCVLSPAEWNTLQSCFKRKGGDAAKASIRRTEKNLEKQSSEKSSGKCRNKVESQGTKIVNLVGSCSIGTKLVKGMEDCMLNDVSQGKEKFPVRAVNVVDDQLPLPFTYITNIVYPYWHHHVEPVGCSCTNGCSDSKKCLCVLKNGGDIPFNENGDIIRAKPLVHECGPKCKCPPSCMNRVSQHGPRHQLEIFKTESRGWGVRSRNHISSGGFICEYVGELLRDKEAEQRVGNDEYLFDICDTHDEGGQGEFDGFPDSKLKDDGFALDAAMCGNIGRFINHSCSPNLYAQEVLYDHDDKKMPHIMFFATEDIPPLQELTYDYNYKMDRVCDVNGNIKTKYCYCGSRECTGRLY